MNKHDMNMPITPGYYALLMTDAFQTLEDAFPTKELITSAKKALNDLPYGMIVCDHAEADEIFYVYQVLPSSRIILLTGDRNLRADTAADAYQKTSASMPDGAVQFFAVVHLSGRKEAMH